MEKEKNTNNPTSEPLPEKNARSAFDFKKRFFFLSSIVSGIIVGSIIFFLFLNTPPDEDFSADETISETAPAKTQYTSSKKEKNKLAGKPVPKVYFEDYDVNATLAAIPSSMSAYILKSGFKKTEILSIGKKLDLSEYKEGKKNENVLMFNTKDKDKKGILSFNKDSGSFYYESYGALRPKEYKKGQSVLQVAGLFLTELGFDETVSCTNTYQKKGLLSDITYVECHRDWNKTKLPVVNLGGLLNIAENKKLSDLTAGMVDDESPLNEVVFNVAKVSSSGISVAYPKDNGRARPDDFNTITFGISDDGRIVTIDSKLRFVDKKSQIDQEEMLLPDEAIATFKKHKYQYALTIPAGSGAVNFDKVYPGNKVTGSEALVNDISLIYLDRPFDLDQEKYEPYYLIRGTAEIDSGYNVRFVQVIPALKSKLSILSQVKEVAGEKTSLAQADKKKLQMESFDPKKVTPTLTPALTLTPAATKVPEDIPAPEEHQCLDDEKSAALEKDIVKEVTLEVPGYGTLVMVGRLHTYYLKSAKISNYSYKTVKEALFKQVEEQFVINVSKWIKNIYLNSTMGRYYKDLPDYNSWNSPEDLYRVFDEMNNATILSGEQLPRGSEAGKQLIRYGAPMTKPVDQIIDNAKYANNTVSNVAKRVLEIKKQNQIDIWAAKEDLFPPETTDIGFWAIFAGTNSEAMYKYSCYISGSSPAIYLYPLEKTNLTVKINAPLTYSDPKINNNAWNIVADKNGVIEQAGIRRSNLYYEYDSSKIKFTQVEDGFVVEFNKWKDFVRNDLSNKFRLSEKEAESMITEINNALIGIKKTAYLKLSLIPQSELNKKLPLSINPVPDNIYRINVFVTPLDNNYQSTLPEINPIVRNGFTVVEIGAYTK